MWSPPFSRPTRRRRRIHINLADFYALVELILASITWRRFVLADPRAAAIATMAATRARRLKADLTSSQPTKDDHRAIRLNTEIEMQQNSRAGVAFFPAVQPRAMPRRYGASYRRGGLKRWPLLVLEPSAQTIAAWQRRTNVWRQGAVPREGAIRAANWNGPPIAPLYFTCLACINVSLTRAVAPP